MQDRQTQAQWLAFEAARRQELRGARRACSISGWIIAASMLLMQFGALAIGQAVAYLTGGYGTDVSLALGCMCYFLLSFFPMLFVCRRWLPGPSGLYLPFSRPRAVGLSGGVLVLLLVVGLGISLAANYPVLLVRALIDQFRLSHAPSMPESQTAAGLTLNLLYSAVAAPLNEEILFRGVAVGLLRRWGDGFAIGISALLFGLYHGNAEQFVFAAIVGAVLAYLRLRTDNLLPGILVHAANNFLATFTMVVSAVWGNSASSLYTVAYFAICIAAGVAALIYLVVRRRREIALMPRRFYTGPGARAGQFLRCGGGWAMLVLGIVPAIASLVGITL